MHRFCENDRRAAEKTCKNRTTVESDDFHKDKDDKKGVRRCYICQKTGHYKTTSLSQHNSLEKINLNVLLSKREELKLTENYIQDNEIIVPGAVDRCPASRIILTHELKEALLEES